MSGLRWPRPAEPERTHLWDDFRDGRATIRFEEEAFDLGSYHVFLDREVDSIAAFRARQQIAFIEEVARWQTDEALSQAAEIELAEIVAEIAGPCHYYAHARHFLEGFSSRGQSVVAGSASSAFKP